MRWWLLILLVVAVPANAATYFIAPAGSGGSDSNNGTSSGTPWLTPNHALNCGDVISAAAGTYNEANFRPGQWGVVTCPANNNVAWLKCAAFDTCKISIGTAGHDAMTPTQSYWGVQGWEVTANSQPSTNQCFEAYPPDNTHTISHIIFANNIANGCGDGGITTGSSTTTVGVDYVAILGNVVYNAAQDNAHCYSGIDIVTPINSDAAAGTHIYIAGNFTWGNVDPNPCQGGWPTDGQGISLDTLNGAGTSYSGQIVIDNNISVYNGASGIQSFQNTGGSPNAPIVIRHNTTYGNQTGSINANPCAEIIANTSLSTQAFLNLVQATPATACVAAVNLYALAMSFGDTTDQFTNNFIYSAGGNNTSGTGSSFSNNLSGNSPLFSNPVEPSAPSCGAFGSVPACMAAMVSNYTAANAISRNYGYQPPGASSYDPLYPQWLCSVTNMPSGLVTPGCVVAGSTTFYSVPGIVGAGCPAAPTLTNPQNPITYGADPTGSADSTTAFQNAANAGDVDVPTGDTFKINGHVDLGTHNMRCEGVPGSTGSAIKRTILQASLTMFEAHGGGSFFNCDVRGFYYNTLAGYQTFFEDFIHLDPPSTGYLIVGNLFNGSEGFTGAIDIRASSGTPPLSTRICGNTFSNCDYYAVQLISGQGALFDHNRGLDCAAWVEADNASQINKANVSNSNHFTFTNGTGNTRHFTPACTHACFGSEFTCGVDASGTAYDYSGNTCENDIIDGPFGSRLEETPDCISGSCPPSFGATYTNETCTGGCSVH